MVAGGGVVQPFNVFQKKDELSPYGFSLPQEPQNTKQKSFTPKWFRDLYGVGNLLTMAVCC
mgnify:CR=1 FL=1